MTAVKKSTLGIILLLLSGNVTSLNRRQITTGGTLHDIKENNINGISNDDLFMSGFPIHSEDDIPEDDQHDSSDDQHDRLEYKDLTAADAFWSRGSRYRPRFRPRYRPRFRPRNRPRFRPRYRPRFRPFRRYRGNKRTFRGDTRRRVGFRRGMQRTRFRRRYITRNLRRSNWRKRRRAAIRRQQKRRQLGRRTRRRTGWWTRKPGKGQRGNKNIRFLEKYGPGIAKIIKALFENGKNGGSVEPQPQRPPPPPPPPEQRSRYLNVVFYNKLKTDVTIIPSSKYVDVLNVPAGNSRQLHYEENNIGKVNPISFVALIIHKVGTVVPLKLNELSSLSLTPISDNKTVIRATITSFNARDQAHETDEASIPNHVAIHVVNDGKYDKHRNRKDVDDEYRNGKYNGDEEETKAEPNPSKSNEENQSRYHDHVNSDENERDIDNTEGESASKVYDEHYDGDDGEDGDDNNNGDYNDNDIHDVDDKEKEDGDEDNFKM